MCINLFQIVITNEEAISAFENVSIRLFDFTDPTSLFIAIPSVNMEELDCSCKIQSENSGTCLQFNKCSCINATAFSHSASKLKICNISTAEKYHLYLNITNVTTKLNNTKLHFYQGLRTCVNTCKGNQQCSHRRYVQALKLTEGNCNCMTLYVHVIFCGESKLPFYFQQCYQNLLK